MHSLSGFDCPRGVNPKTPFYLSVWDLYVLINIKDPIVKHSWKDHCSKPTASVEETEAQNGTQPGTARGNKKS